MADQQAADGDMTEALAELTQTLERNPHDAQAISAVVDLLTSTDLSIASKVRVACGELLTTYGDPRPGVCDLPPAMVPIAGGMFHIGHTQDELQRLPVDHQNIFGDTINTYIEPARMPDFDIARYPLTNAQYQLFIEAGGYDPEAPWWTDAGRAWLLQDDSTIPGQEQQRHHPKQKPIGWDSPHGGIANPNHPVYGIHLYGALAFCAWLTSHLNDGFSYQVSTEAEWEYAARGPGRRTYPWGEAPPDPERVNTTQGVAGYTAVGCFPAGATPDGVFDMVGSIWQLTENVYMLYGVPTSEPTPDTFMIVRGLPGTVPPQLLRATFRGRFQLKNRVGGVRLVRHRVG